MIGLLLKGMVLLVLSGILAYIVTLISSSSGDVRINIDGQELSISIFTGVLTFIGLLILFWLLSYLVGLILAIFKFISGDETAISRYLDRSRRTKGYNELSNALVSLYEGNKSDALLHSNRAKKLLSNNKLSLLIDTQIAHQKGESKLAIANYKKLLKGKDTRLIALSGIVSEKIKQGDIGEALDLAKKTFELNPRNPNATVTLFNLQIQERDWDGAQKTLQAKRKLEKIPRDVFLRQESILIFAKAREDRAMGRTKEALSGALTAVRQNPEFVPALNFLVELELLSGNKKRVEKLLRKAWSLFPHPDIAKGFASLLPEETPSERLVRFESFLKINDKSSHSAILAAELHIANEDFLAAKKIMSEIVLDDPDNRVLTLMAVIERGCGAADEVVRGWLTKAVYAPKAPDWICNRCGFQTDWEPACPSCEGFDTICWKRPPLYKDTIDSSKLLPLLTGSENSSELSDKVKDIGAENKKLKAKVPKANSKKAIEDNVVTKAREIN